MLARSVLLSTPSVVPLNISMIEVLQRPIESTLRAPIAVVHQRPFTLAPTRVQRLCSSASSTKSVCMELLTRQPTMRRAKTSITKATYTKPCQVET